ncbi:uncharacterized protein MYCFIDRAFT_175843 [Pseudocercospora fijiensis CIRAD86]|uniref:Uncharacterized protein n=1 Tax=Pseudocercospora fijiensis (strain CIRAD86) TaxID=383855 RepID=M2ZTG8_PSEFD|nr:uncharacterized protein MYCFIDRAFT_175843 [Pseudocercospora fijiensis CIRAD86]EME82294.1 hypothetical protein MYCFIDRAFT_175843 [Pseudocercospora fijiensis CIRAD86]
MLSPKPCQALHVPKVSASRPTTDLLALQTQLVHRTTVCKSQTSANMATPTHTTPSAMTTPRNAATRVFGISELLEVILDHVRANAPPKTFFNGHHFQNAPSKALIKLTGVNHTFKACIEQSIILQKHTWLGEADCIVSNPTCLSIPAVLVDRKRQTTVTQAAHIAPLLWFVSRQLGCPLTRLDFDNITKTFLMHFNFDTSSNCSTVEWDHSFSWENMRGVRGPPGIKIFMVITVIFDNKGKSESYMKGFELLCMDAYLGEFLQKMREIHRYGWSEHLAMRDLDIMSAERAATRRVDSTLLLRAALEGGWRLNEVDRISKRTTSDPAGCMSNLYNPMLAVGMRSRVLRPIVGRVIEDENSSIKNPSRLEGPIREWEVKPDGSNVCFPVQLFGSTSMRCEREREVSVDGSQPSRPLQLPFSTSTMLCD